MVVAFSISLTSILIQNTLLNQYIFMELVLTSCCSLVPLATSKIGERKITSDHHRLIVLQIVAASNQLCLNLWF